MICLELAAHIFLWVGVWVQLLEALYFVVKEPIASWEEMLGSVLVHVPQHPVGGAGKVLDHFSACAPEFTKICFFIPEFVNKCPEFFGLLGVHNVTLVANSGREQIS